MKRQVRGSVTVDAYRVATLAVEQGVAYGWRRAHKHVAHPTEQQVCEAMVENVLSELCEWFHFSEGSPGR